MLVYWLMYLTAVIGAINNAGMQVRSSRTAWIIIGLFYTVLIGWRQSGGDWYNYSIRFEEMAYLSFEEVFNTKDIGYQLVSYYMYQWDWGFYALTMFCAVISMTGLIVFLRQQINPWLGLAVAVPYLIIVVYMGYMRQGIALGLVMWGIVALHQGKFYRFIFFIILATTFHKSAIMMIAFGIFSRKNKWWLNLLGVVIAGAGVWTSFVSAGAVELWKNYVEAQMQSQGAMIRVLLNALPALLLLIFRKQWKMHFSDYVFWLMIALVSLVSIGLVGIASTAVDRMALYFIPLQIVVFTRLPVLARNIVSPKITTFLILIFYFLILFVWLNYSVHSGWWIPYSNYLWSGIF